MAQPLAAQDMTAFVLRLLAWATVTMTGALLLETYLVFWRGQPGASALGAGGTAAALGYAVALAAAVAIAVQGRMRSLHAESELISALVRYIARGAFFAVLFVGIGDALVSFLRIEDALAGIFGPQIASDLGRTSFRGAHLHMPLVAVGFIVALFTRTLGFIWLALMVVVAQLALVIGRFVFSYEQAFMSDLVRMWYSALFLFASAYTLVEEGHVRVDIFYSAMRLRSRALVNGIGAVLLGMPMCWIILIYGTATSASQIVGPFLRFEQSQQSYGMFTKYLLAVYLAIFAVTMLFQFAAMVLRAAAEWRGEPEALRDVERRQTQAEMGY